MSMLGMTTPRALVRLQAGAAELVLAPSLGGAVVSWRRADEALFRPPLADALQADSPRDLGSYPLFPYSNRIGARRFSFAGVAYDLPDLMNGWAIHGAGWRLPWAAHEADGKVTLSLDYPGGALWPFAFRAEQIFELEEDALTLRCVITNRHGGPAPVGFGQHPYFPRSPGCTLRFAASGVQMPGPDKIPVSHQAVPPEWNHEAGLAVGSVALDHCFTGWTGFARLSYPDRGLAIDITADPIFANAVVFVPPGQDFFAFEPVSNITDALNRMDGALPPGLFVVAPGAQIRGSIRFAVRPHSAE
jgi:aldose 1-epimerase